MKMNSLGSQLNPARNNNDIRKALIGRRYGIIYTLGTFKIDHDVLLELEIHNVKLLAVGRIKGRCF